MSCYNCGDGKPKTLAERLNKRATIQTPPTGTDAYGQPNTEWTNGAKIWAAIEPLRGREFFAAQAENAEVTTRIRIRYRSDVDRTMRIKYKDIIFEILYIINPEMANEELQLMCKERQ